MSREELDRAELGDRVAEALKAQNAAAQPYPYTCDRCLDSRATHLLVYDYAHPRTSLPCRSGHGLCGPCAHKPLPADSSTRWLFELVPDRCEDAATAAGGAETEEEQPDV